MPENQKGANDWYIYARPRSFDDVVLPTPFKRYLDKCVKEDEWPRATLLLGKYGTGKTTVAQIMAAYMCSRKVENGQLDWENDPTCVSIKEERWDRDVILLDGTQLSADDIRTKLEQFLSTPSFRDRRKCIILDETQDLSNQAVKALLKVAEGYRKGYHVIFTAMSKLPKEGKALESRCKKWNLPQLEVKDIYQYLGKVCQDQGMTKDASVPKEFYTKGLEFIAQNCDYSLRTAINFLEQSYKGLIFTPDEIKSNFNIVTYEDTLASIKLLAKGAVDDPVVFDTIVCKEKEDKFNLFYKIIGDAEVYRVFGHYHEDDEKWKDRDLAELSSAPYFEWVRDSYVELAKLGGVYVKQGDYLILLSRLVERIRKAKETCPPEMGRALGEAIQEESKKTRRRVVS